jgi:hypothetical protein
MSRIVRPTDTSSTEIGVRHHIRRWRRVMLRDEEGNTHFIEYRFWSTGMRLVLCPLTQQLLRVPLTQAWSLRGISVRHVQKTNVHNAQTGAGSTSYKVHKALSSHFLTLLHQYGRRSEYQLLRRMTVEEHFIDLSRVEVEFFEYVTISGLGLFRGFNMFNIFATSSYGNRLTLRERYDVVEIVIPTEKRGAIAGSPNLLRSSEDSAFAQVLAILSLRSIDSSESRCYLVVAFFSSETGSRRTGFDRMQSSSRVHGCYYGKVNSQWLYITPLDTLKGPAMAIVDRNGSTLRGGSSTNSSSYFIFSLQYFSRGGWSAEIENVVDWDHDLPSLGHREYESEDFDSSDVDFL